MSPPGMSRQLTVYEMSEESVEEEEDEDEDEDEEEG